MTKKFLPPYIIEVKSFFWDENTRGLTFWPFIFVTDKEDRTSVEHEKIHSRQQVRGFLVFFYIRYLLEIFLFGYENVSYEKEANTHETDWLEKESQADWKEQKE